MGMRPAKTASPRRTSFQQYLPPPRASVSGPETAQPPSLAGRPGHPTSLPKGWERHTDERGVYYLNTKRGEEKQREFPTAPATPLPAPWIWKEDGGVLPFLEGGRGIYRNPIPKFKIPPQEKRPTSSLGRRRLAEGHPVFRR